MTEIYSELEPCSTPVEVEPELSAGLDVPEAARRFLTVVGLPRSFPHYFTTVGDRYQDPAVDVPDGASLIGS